MVAHRNWQGYRVPRLSDQSYRLQMVYSHLGCSCPVKPLMPFIGRAQVLVALDALPPPLNSQPWVAVQKPPQTATRKRHVRGVSRQGHRVVRGATAASPPQHVNRTAAQRSSQMPHLKRLDTRRFVNEALAELAAVSMLLRRRALASSSTIHANTLITGWLYAWYCRSIPWSVNGACVHPCAESTGADTCPQVSRDGKGPLGTATGHPPHAVGASLTNL